MVQLLNFNNYRFKHCWLYSRECSQYDHAELKLVTYYLKDFSKDLPEIRLFGDMK